MPVGEACAATTSFGEEKRTEPVSRERRAERGAGECRLENHRSRQKRSLFGVVYSSEGMTISINPGRTLATKTKEGFSFSGRETADAVDYEWISFRIWSM